MWAFLAGAFVGVPAGIVIASMCVAAARADEQMVAEVYRRRLAEVLAARNYVHGQPLGRERPELRN